jgi:hypothetical protein
MSEATSDLTALGNEARRLLEVLLEHAGEDGRAQVSTAALMRETGLTQGGLIRARSELTSNLLVKVEKGYTASGRLGANVHTLNPALLEPASSVEMEDESGQNMTEEPALALVPADMPVRAASEEPTPERQGFWSRLFRRSRTA